MTIPTILRLPAVLLAILLPSFAQQLPYNPTTLLQTNGSNIYILSPESPSSQFAVLDGSKTIGAAQSPTVLTASLPFLSKSKAIIPVTDDDSISVLVGDCSSAGDGLELWRFNTSDEKNKAWAQVDLSLSDSSLGVNYLSAGFSFSPTNSTDDAGIYIFGGMCPNGPTNASSWTSDADYSNTMLTIALTSQTDYQLSMTGARAPPIAEAGLTITSLTPSVSNSSSGAISRQQSFVLIGGHTTTAFINMSQVALFSLPQQAWSFIGVSQPAASGSSELLRRDDGTVEPRSGHTAVMTEDGSKIIVFGGWVGTVANAANPQLAILEVGQGYGGSADWKWTVPQQTASPLTEGQGIYSHGAVMLPGDIMMVSGGRTIPAPSGKTKRDTSAFMFFNITSSTWLTSYVHPTGSGVGIDDSGMNKSQKAGLGAGIGLGLAAAGAISIAYLLYARRMRQKKRLREKELRAMALGADRSYSMVFHEKLGHQPEYRSASWGNRMEHSIEHDGQHHDDDWNPKMWEDSAEMYGAIQDDSVRQAERTGLHLDVPSPTRGLRRNMHSRGANGYNTNFKRASGGPGAVFPIEEEDEPGSHKGSLKRSRNSLPPRPLSDPFKDPPILEPTDEEAERRKKEVQGWVDDWACAAESMSMSRNPSKTYSRTYSNLSAYNSSSNSGHDGRSSPEKSDRTSSNLSDNSYTSHYSMQRSMVGSLSRTISQRSVSAGYALFAGAAAAMGRFATKQDTLDRSTSRRSISHGDLATLAVRNRNESTRRDGVEQIHSDRHYQDELDRSTPPESPIKDYKARDRTSSITSQGRRALSLLGGVKRVLTGTGNANVQDKIAHFESQSGASSPTKHSGLPPMSEVSPRRATSAAGTFWKHRQGAKDWDDPKSGVENSSADPKTGPELHPGQHPELDDSEWDIETAIQRRVVQVMFTVPKEKLRVVNADALSLLSRSDTNASDPAQRDADIRRMPSVTEEGKKLFGSPRDRLGNNEKVVEKMRSTATIGKAI